MLYSSLPTVYVLDGDNVVVDGTVGIDDGLGEWLEGLLSAQNEPAG